MMHSVPGKMLQLVLLGVLLVPMGCQQTETIVPVSGQILVDGQPAAGALVVFHAEDDKQKARPSGHTDDQGRFQLTTRNRGDGAPPGDYRVTVLWYLVPLTDGSVDETVAQNQLPASYASPQNSGLKVTIRPGSNQLEAFNLSSN